MKKILSLLMSFILVFSLAACGSKPAEEKEDKTANVAGENTDNSEETENTKDGKKVLNKIITENIPSLVTWLATDNVSFEILGNVNSGLFVHDVEGATVEDLVDTYEVSEDGLTYTFHLKDQNWVTVDGEVYAPVTAQDFVYPIKRILDPKEAAQYAFMVATAGIKNGAVTVALSEGLAGYEKAKKDLEKLDIKSFKDSENETAQQQYDKQKASLESSIKTAEDEYIAQYGSLEKAYEEVYKLIDEVGVKAIDDKTLEYQLEVPVPFFTSMLLFPSFFPANQKFVEEKGDKYGSSVDNFLYNGAYIFKDWKISQRHYIVKNDAYWNAANVKLDGVDYRVIEGVDNDTTVNMYLEGQTHVTGLSGENVEKYGNRPDVQLTEDTNIFYIQMNEGNGEATSNKALLANPKARKALNMGFDKKYISETILANGSIAADYFVPKGLQTSSAHGDKDFREVAEEMYPGAKDGYNRYNVEEAKKLWAEAKAEAGVKDVQLEIMIFQGDLASNMGTHIKNEWEKNLEGLTIILKPLPFSEKIARANRGDFELDLAGWGPDYPDAMTFMDLWVTGGGHNKVGYSNPEYDAAIASAKSGELTKPEKAKERIEKLVEMEKVLLEQDQVIIPLYQRGGTGLRDPRISGWKLQSFGPDYIYQWVDLSEE